MKHNIITNLFPYVDIHLIGVRVRNIMASSGLMSWLILWLIARVTIFWSFNLSFPGMQLNMTRVSYNRTKLRYYNKL